MSVVNSSLVGDYARAVSQFQVASGGSYAGPSMPMDVLRSLIGSTEGINPQDLVASTGAAVGKQGRGSGGGLGGLGGFLLDTALSFAGGALQEHMRGVQEDHEEQTRDTRQLQESAQECSTAIGDVVDVSDSALTELFSASIPLLNLLSMVLSKHPLGKIIVPMISEIGGDLIEKTNETIASTCRDRDAAIEACYEEFESRCESLSQKPLPQTPPEPECAAPTEAQPQPGSAACPPPPQEACPPSTRPAQAPPAQTPLPSPSDPSECPPPTTPAAVPPSPEPPLVPPAPCIPSSSDSAPPQPDLEVEKVCCGSLGSAGAGIALLGLGLLVAVAVECLAPESPAPEPCPEPEPEPCPEPEPEPAPQPEPEGSPPAPEDIIPPPPELAAVPEPEPPPKKLVPLPAAAEVPDSASGPSGPVASPVPPAFEQPLSPENNEDAGRARKAGQW